MTASDHCSSREKTLASRGPSTHEAALLFLRISAQCAVVDCVCPRQIFLPKFFEALNQRWVRTVFCEPKRLFCSISKIGRVCHGTPNTKLTTTINDIAAVSGCHLRSKRTIRRSKQAGLLGDGRAQIKDPVSIRQRLAAVEDRAVPGHWEGDLLSGSKNSHIATLVERHSRYVMLAKVANKDTQSVVSALIKQSCRASCIGP
jgi:IS30 family transposase